jgi:hypothetical protein
MPFLGKTPTKFLDANVNIDGGNIDGTTIGATLAASATVTTFTSTGIDDNATSTAITIDSSERTSFASASNRPIAAVSTDTNAFVAFQDTNTGSETDDMVFYANAQERMRIKGSNVGIGVTDPDNLLTVGGGTQPRILIRANGDAGASQLNFGDASDIDVGRLRYDHSDNSMGFFTSATERMRIDASGNVGIGTTPNQQGSTKTLHIQNASGATLKLEDGTDEFDIQNVGGTGFLVTRSANPIAFYTNSSERMRIDSSGRVGIGTTSPNSNIADGIDCNSTLYGRYDFTSGVPSTGLGQECHLQVLVWSALLMETPVVFLRETWFYNVVPE